MNFLHIFRTPCLAILWSGQMLSAIGDQLFNVALIWTTTRLLGSVAGSVVALGSLAALLAGLPGGVLADRWPRHLTLIGVDVLRALAIGVLALLAVSSWIQPWHLVLIIMLIETLGTLFDPALVASLPLLTQDSKQLYATNVLMDGTQRLARILGPGLTGLLLLLLPLTQFFTLDAISFGFSALSILALMRHFPTRSTHIANFPAHKGQFFADISEALRDLRAHRMLAWALGSLGLCNIAWSAIFLVGVPLLVARMPGASAGIYGLIVGAYGVGNVLSLFASSNLAHTRDLRWMYAGQIVLGAGFLLLASVVSPVVAMAGAAIAAFGSPVGDLIILTMIQTDFPPERIGKMYSLRRLIAGSGLMLGAALAVPLFTWLSIPTGIAICALAIVLIGGISLARFWRSTSTMYRKGSSVLK
jgi:MFS transporter, DHA3 family, macrolide efflux protein